MNWLAHLYLSEPSPAFRIGNLLPDMVPPAQWAHLPREFLRGAVCHRQIDAFTDAHPVVRRSIARVPAPFRRYAGILTDVFYDHVLAREWSAYSPLTLPEFAAEVYAGFARELHRLTPLAQQRLEWMRESNLLCTYLEREGISRALGRLGQRFRRPVALDEATVILETDYGAWAADFQEFFPQLIACVATGSGDTNPARQSGSPDRRSAE